MKKVVLVLSILLLVSFTSNKPKKMHYSAAKKHKILRLISKNKKVMQSLKKIKYAQTRNTIKENIAIFYAMSKSDQNYTLRIAISKMYKNKYINKQEATILSSFLLNRKELKREYVQKIRNRKYSTKIAQTVISQVVQDYLDQKNKVSTQGSFGRAVGSILGAAAGIGTGLLIEPPPLNPAAVIALGALGAKVGSDVGDAAEDAASGGDDKGGDKENNDNDEDNDDNTPVNGEDTSNCIGYPFTPPN